MILNRGKGNIMRLDTIENRLAARFYENNAAIIKNKELDCEIVFGENYGKFSL